MIDQAMTTGTLEEPLDPTTETEEWLAEGKTPQFNSAELRAIVWLVERELQANIDDDGDLFGFFLLDSLKKKLEDATAGLGG